MGPTDIPLLNIDQSDLQYNMKIDPTGPYILVIEYVTQIVTPDPNAVIGVQVSNGTESSPRGIITIRFQSGDALETNAVINLNACPYTTPCRQVVPDEVAKIFVVNVVDPNNIIYLEVSFKGFIFHPGGHYNITIRYLYNKNIK